MTNMPKKASAFCLVFTVYYPFFLRSSLNALRLTLLFPSAKRAFNRRCFSSNAYSVACLQQRCAELGLSCNNYLDRAVLRKPLQGKKINTRGKIFHRDTNIMDACIIIVLGLFLYHLPKHIA